MKKRIIKYLEDGQILHIGDISVEGPANDIKISCPDTDKQLTRLLEQMSRTKSIECDRCVPIEGGTAFTFVEVKFEDELFWPSVGHVLSGMGYCLET